MSEATARGLVHVYTGNVVDPDGGSSWCAGCGALLIERDGYRLGRWGLDAGGRCRACGLALPGRFLHPLFVEPGGYPLPVDPSYRRVGAEQLGPAGNTGEVEQP